MISREQALYVTLNQNFSTRLFESHRRLMSEFAWSGRTRTLRQAWRRGWRSASLPTAHEINSRTLSELSSRSTAQTSDYLHRVQVTCRRGQDRAYFSGTPYRVCNQVILFLVTGQSGTVLREKSSVALLKEVALSSYSSALLQRRTQMGLTKERTGSFEPPTPRLEEYVVPKPHSPAAEYLARPTQSFENSGKLPSNGD